MNHYIYKDRIKFDDWKIMEQFVHKGDFFFKFDIKPGYHHVDIWEEHQKYLGFSWNLWGHDRYFLFTVLPFGITSCPFIFTNVMRVLIKHWRERGIQISCFLDDGLAVDKDQGKLKEQSLLVQTSLKESGFLVNEDKFHWAPTREITWLVVYINTEVAYFITENRISSLMYTLYNIISQLPYTTPRKIARLCGKLVSCKFVLGRIVQLKTRRLHNIIATRSGWNTLISIEGFPRAIEELFFWKHDLCSFNSRKFNEHYTPASLAYSNASSTGIAAHVNVHNEEKIAYRNLSETECLKSSTWRELSAIAFAVNSFK